MGVGRGSGRARRGNPHRTPMSKKTNARKKAKKAPPPPVYDAGNDPSLTASSDITSPNLSGETVIVPTQDGAHEPYILIPDLSGFVPAPDIEWSKGNKPGKHKGKHKGKRGKSASTDTGNVLGEPSPAILFGDGPETPWAGAVNAANRANVQEVPEGMAVILSKRNVLIALAVAAGLGLVYFAVRR